MDKIFPDLPQYSDCVCVCVCLHEGFKTVSLRFPKSRFQFLVGGKGQVRFVGSRVAQLFRALFTGFGIY